MFLSTAASYTSRLVALLAITLGISAADIALGQDDAPQQVFAAQRDLLQWLGEGKNGQGWRKYLDTNELYSQTQLGEYASLETLKEILAKYEGDAEGLELPQFVSVRTKLAKWIEQFPTEQESVADEIAGAQEQFKPVTPEQAAAAKKQLEAAIAKLESFIHNSGKATEDGWKNYLHWDDMTEQLAADDPDLAALERCYLRFNSGVKGLEYPRFAAVRKGLRRYIDLQFFATTMQLKEMYEMQLGLLSENLKKYQETPNPDDAAAIGAQLGWFAQAGQIPGLIAEARKSLNRPNLFVAVSERFVGYGIDRKVNDVAPVRDNILGTSIHGTGRTVGDLTADLVPSLSNAKLQLVLNAVTTSNNMGYNGPVTVHSTGVTSVYGTKTLLIDPDGVRGLPATAICDTNSTFNSINAGSALVRRIGTQKAYNQKSQAEAIGSRHAEQRVARRLDEQTVDLLKDANTRLKKEVRQPLDSRGEFPEFFNIASTSDALNVIMLKANRFQLAAPTAPPVPSPKSADIAVQVHESMPTNIAEVLVGGLKLTDVKMVKMLKERGTEIPEELQITPDKDPWSITFDYQRPVEVRFAKDRVEIAIRGRQFTRGDTEFNDIVKISAAYTVERGEKGAKLTRDGDVLVEFIGKERQGFRLITFKTFLHKKFSALFEPEIVGEGLKLQGRWEGAGPLNLEDLVVDEGWATIGWVMPDEKSAGQDLASSAKPVE
ncbi:hypothetical protein [Blastopirellula retiformator]|uniref:SLA1 homology domain-containing protein n=1 Tax=Blastopirellula retiformator TaxID=2527970 RepID=A0A5C5UY66_9BACT|nr:hypothetical protein [Blastopirellula retiformator]TWT30789.1 hypothetical protein Enr8_43140 [Blastopirellula retiformator]